VKLVFNGLEIRDINQRFEDVTDIANMKEAALSWAVVFYGIGLALILSPALWWVSRRSGKKRR
jgi:hypothetical protein